MMHVVCGRFFLGQRPLASLVPHLLFYPSLPASPMRASRFLLPTAAVAGALALALMVPSDLMAQLPNFTTATGAVKTEAKPVIQTARFVIAVVAALTGFWQGFKAAKGDNKGWIATILLFIIAGVAASPSSTFTMLGLSQLCTPLREWGAC